jgi:hypothetical protein
MVKLKTKKIDPNKLEKRLIIEATGLLNGLGNILIPRGEASFSDTDEIATLPVSHNGNNLSLVYSGKTLKLICSEASLISSYNIHSMNCLTGARTKFTEDLRDKYN